MTFGEDHSRVRTGAGPQMMAALRNGGEQAAAHVRQAVHGGDEGCDLVAIHDLGLGQHQPFGLVEQADQRSGAPVGRACATQGSCRRRRTPSAAGCPAAIGGRWPGGRLDSRSPTP